ncbi:hypothetical protein [Terrabacter sp. NPDC000476]|uniref:hypothetical protein n=1 Tax=Terrabacter sp. NPDC000476 TaxID=3154258 RepID=UPI00331863D2
MRRRTVAVVAAVVVGVVGLTGLVGVLLGRAGVGPLRDEPARVSLAPVGVQLLGEGGDPLVVMVVFPWTQDGICVGQVAVAASETASAVSVEQVTGFAEPQGRACAGVGTDGRTASVELRLASPLGERAVTRRVDGAAVPVTRPCERDGVASWCPRST